MQIHDPPNLIDNPRPVKRTKRTTYTEELTFLEPLINNISEVNINNVIEQLNNWNLENNHSENVWDKKRVMKWVNTRTRKDRLAKEKLDIK